MWSRYLVVCLAAVFVAHASIAGAVTKAVSTTKKEKKEKKAVEVVADNNCSQPCVVLGQVYINKFTIFSSCAEKLGKHASKDYGADAILKFKQTPLGQGGVQCEGIAVRWALEGEEGIQKITDETPIPILKKK